MATIPSIPTLPGLPSITLTCGSNSTLGQLNSQRNTILGLLSNKKAGLLTLASQIPELKGILSQIQHTESMVFSLQSDIASLQAAHYSPSAVLAFLNRWGSKIPNAQLQTLLAQVNSAVHGGTSLDICSAIPNININPTTGAVIHLAKSSQTPSIAPISAVALVPTVVDHTRQVSTGDSGQKLTIMSDYFSKVRNPVSSQVWDPMQKKKDALVKTLLAAEDAASSVFDKVKQYGKDSKQLNADGLLTPAEFSAAQAYNTAHHAYANYNWGSANTKAWFWRIQEVLSGKMLQTAYDAKRKELVEDPDFAEFLPYLTTTESIINSNKDLVLAYNSYTANTSY